MRKLQIIPVAALILLVAALSLTACAPTETPPTLTTSSPEQPTIRSTATERPTPTATARPPSEGPFLLLQTGVGTYQVLDFDRQIALPFAPPGEASRYPLAGNLSPSGTQIIFPVSATEIQIMDLQTGSINTNYDLSNNLFSPERATEAALAALSNLDDTFEHLLAAVEMAYADSILNIRWYKSDAYRLSVLSASEASTNLYLDEHLTGTRTLLEDLPGLVETYQVNATGEWILLKKGYNFEPGVWEDDAYYILHIADRQVAALPLPKDSANPSVSWFTADSIGIIHQTQPAGGVGFTLLDVESGQAHTVVEGAFTSLHQFKGNLLLIQQPPDSGETHLQILDPTGTVQVQQTLTDSCFLNALTSDRIILNCETESQILDANLQARPFGDPVFLLSAAPDGANFVLVTRTDECFLLDSSLENSQPLVLAGVPLEVRWLPNSSGFLYRTLGKLYQYDLITGNSLLWLESDLFGDYTHLNAVWINLE